MARPGVTYHEVAVAAQELIAAGKNPTIDAIRIALGTGSNSTLGLHLRTFRERQGQTQQIATKENIPEELVAVIKGLWERVINQADEKISLIAQQTTNDIATLKNQIDVLSKDNSHLKQIIQTTKQERDSLLHEKNVLEQLLSNAKLELVKFEEKTAGLLQHLEDKSARIDEIQRFNKQIQANLEHYREATLIDRQEEKQRFQEQQKILETTISQLNQKITQLTTENISLQQQSQKINFENEKIQSDLHQLIVQSEESKKHIHHIEYQLSNKKQELEQFHALQIKHREQAQLINDLKTQHALVLQQLQAEKLKCDELISQNKSLASEKWMLGQEKAKLEGQLKQLDGAFKNKKHSSQLEKNLV